MNRAMSDLRRANLNRAIIQKHREKMNNNQEIARRMFASQFGESESIQVNAQPHEVYDYSKIISEHDSKKNHIVCLMTSWQKRIKYVATAITYLLAQTIKPDEIWLTLSTEEFPNREKDLPNDLLSLVNDSKLQIFWVEENTKTIKKVFPIIDKFNDEDIIVNVDDDLCYPNDLIASRLYDY